MHKLLLLVCYFLTVSTTLSFAQSNTNLNRAGNFAVLASTQIINNGNSSVTGNLGISPGNTIIGANTLEVFGRQELGTAVAATAQQDARAAYNALSSSTAQTLGANIGNQTQLLTPGVYKISGNANLSNIILLDGQGDVNASFVFIVEGNLTSTANAGVLGLNGTQAKNITWVVQGSVRLGQSTVLQGSLLAQRNIVLESGTSIIGRAISLEGSITLNSNNIFLPTVILANLAVTKQVEVGDYFVGEQVAYTVTARNAGPGAATNVIVQEIVPAGLELVSATPSKGTYSTADNNWNINELGVNESVTLRLVFRIVAPGTIINKVTIESLDNPDPDPSNNENEETIAAVCAPLDVAVTGGANQCANAANVTFTVTEVFGATYSFALPADWTLVSQEGNAVVVTVGETTGSVSATVTNLCGERATAEVKVAVTPTPDTPTITGNDIVCVNSATNTYTATGITGDVTYEWAVTGDLAIVSGQGTNAVVVKSTGAAGGTVAVKAITTVCSIAGATAVKTVTAITAPAAPAAITGSTAVCEGDEVTYAVAAIEGAATYNWSVPTTAGWSILSGAGTREIRVRIGAASGSVSISAGNSCGESSATTAAITVTNKPAAPAITGAATSSCVGTELSFSVPAVSGATGYAWTLPNTWTAIGDLTSNTIRVIVGTEPGNITAAVTNTCGTGDAASLAVTPIIPPAAPVAPTITGNDIVCISSAANTYTATGVSGSVTYIWATAGDLEIVSGQGSNTVVVRSTGAAGGTLSVRAVTTVCEVAGATATKTITGITTPAAPAAIAGGTDVCEGTEVTYSVAEVNTATSYTWTVPTGSGWEILSGQDTREIRVKVGTASGSIAVTASNSCGTSTATSTAVTVTNKPAAPAITGATTGCVGTEFTFSVPAVTGATGYVWTIPATWTAVGSLTGNTIRVIAGTQAGDITAAVTNRCGTGAVETVQVNPTALPATPVTPTITGADAVCVNSVDNTYTATGVTGAVTYAWTATGSLEIVSGQGTGTVVVRNTGAAGGTLSVMATTTTCAVSGGLATKTITTTATPAAPAAILGNNAPVCEGEEMTYSVAAVSGATTYTWTVPTGNGWELLSGAGTSEIRVRVGAAPGSIAVTASNSCGTSSSATTAVAVTNRPAAQTISGATTGCIGSELTFSVPTVTGATAYAWTIPTTWTAVGNLTSNTIRVVVGAGAGNITATVSNSCGAGAQASIEVAPTTAPATPGAITVPAQICANSTGNAISIAAVAGASSYAWTLPAGWEITSGSGTNSIVVRAGAASGAVSVTATGACGTSGAASANVDVATPPAVTGNITDNSDVCKGLTYSVASVPGATAYTWTVSTGFTIVSGQGTTSITVSATSPTARGEVTVTAMSGNCASPVPARANMDASLADGQLNFPKAFSPNGDGNNDTWVIKNLDKFSENEVTIFNSWGSEVYKKKNYQNDWNGLRLGQGTYYYRARVKLCDGVMKEYTGYVTIFR